MPSALYPVCLYVVIDCIYCFTSVNFPPVTGDFLKKACRVKQAFTFTSIPVNLANQPLKNLMDHLWAVLGWFYRKGNGKGF